MHIRNLILGGLYTFSKTVFLQQKGVKYYFLIWGMTKWIITLKPLISQNIVIKVSIWQWRKGTIGIVFFIYIKHQTFGMKIYEIYECKYWRSTVKNDTKKHLTPNCSDFNFFSFLETNKERPLQHSKIIFFSC